ncbi:dnaJ, partial [Symbiodinium sp. KB8]
MLRLSRALRAKHCPYAILGVAQNASTEDIKRAFQERAKITHPDVVKGRDKHFREMDRTTGMQKDYSCRSRSYGASLISATGGPVAKARAFPKRPARSSTTIRWAVQGPALEANTDTVGKAQQACKVLARCRKSRRCSSLPSWAASSPTSTTKPTTRASCVPSSTR